MYMEYNYENHNDIEIYRYWNRVYQVNITYVHAYIVNMSLQRSLLIFTKRPHSS